MWQVDTVDETLTNKQQEACALGFGEGECQLGFSLDASWAGLEP